MGLGAGGVSPGTAAALRPRGSRRARTEQLEHHVFKLLQEVCTGCQGGMAGERNQTNRLKDGKVGNNIFLKIHPVWKGNENLN